MNNPNRTRYREHSRVERYASGVNINERQPNREARGQHTHGIVLILERIKTVGMAEGRI